MTPALRQKKLLTRLQERKMLTVEELAQEFSASKETIRRDLTVLAERNLLRKVHGGAVCMPSNFEQGFPERSRTAREEKLTACKKALPLVKPGESIFIDNGTTTVIFAELLQELPELTILTNSIHIAGILCARHKVFLLGGWVNGANWGTTGSSAIEQLERFHTDHAFLSIGGIGPEHGFSNFTEDDAALARGMLRNATKTTIIADHSKFWKNALVRVCPLGDVDYLATDGEVPEEFLPFFEQGGVQIL